MLELDGLSLGYDGADVVRNASLKVGGGEIVALVGANGAGKSSIAQAISGLLAPRSGSIIFNGKPIHALSPGARLKLGIAHVPEGRQLFPQLTVADNIALGAYATSSDGIAERRTLVDRLFPQLSSRMADLACNLSGGQQQMVALARGLMSGPKMLVLDEPSLGLAPLMVREIFALVCRLRESCVGVLLAEQNARMSLAVADRGYVIEAGKVIAEGSGAELLADPSIAEKYLGMGHDVHGAEDQIRAKSEELLRLIGRSAAQPRKHI